MLRLDGVSASYRGLRALQGVSLEVADGEILATTPALPMTTTQLHKGLAVIGRAGVDADEGQGPLWSPWRGTHALAQKTISGRPPHAHPFPLCPIRPFTSNQLTIFPAVLSPVT